MAEHRRQATVASTACHRLTSDAAKHCHGSCNTTQCQQCGPHLEGPPSGAAWLLGPQSFCWVNQLGRDPQGLPGAGHAGPLARSGSTCGAGRSRYLGPVGLRSPAGRNTQDPPQPCVSMTPSPATPDLPCLNALGSAASIPWQTSCRHKPRQPLCISVADLARTPCRAAGKSDADSQRSGLEEGGIHCMYGCRQFST